MALMANGPTDYDDLCRNVNRERVWEWVRRQCFEGAEEAEKVLEEEEAEEKVEEESETEVKGS